MTTNGYIHQLRRSNNLIVADYAQSDGCANAKGERGNIPQMFYAWNGTVVCPSILLTP
ncbi:hypothetical protein LC613_35460 [Nostoc sphaeroides CHAB 2801]|uniref:hypothetical protein n=1 Tax=Nostoc sphaeroides TaxID=446679 RepID=UPI001E624ECC|nr:hypothetical protein [Nostoc sphaeroides]MCC5632847.1 hypothetical protein [Nostoc sphaeroides CHAB 2801]